MKTILMALALTGGNWVIWALIAASVAAVAAIYERFVLLKAESEALARLRGPFLAALDGPDLDAARKALDGAPGCASRALAEAVA
ncbi:MAG: hypothetical protein KGM24_13755, partial [Elusimicrobia bacterium]|nr:hypothetical protein [Elusimicrobiota bacterium]